MYWDVAFCHYRALFTLPPSDASRSAFLMVNLKFTLFLSGLKDVRRYGGVGVLAARASERMSGGKDLGTGCPMLVVSLVEPFDYAWVRPW